MMTKNNKQFVRAEIPTENFSKGAIPQAIYKLIISIFILFLNG
jgi:hypothetical protein